MVSLEVAQLVTGEAPLGLYLLGSHSTGHFHLKDRIIGYSLLQIAGDEQPFVVFLRRLIAIGICPFLGRRLRMDWAVFLNLRDGGSKSCGLVKSWLVTRGMASGVWLAGGRTGTFAFEPLITGYVGFVSLNSLIHLLRSQFASILGYLGVQNVSYLFMDSVHGNLVLEGLKLLVGQLILPILTQVAHRGTYPY